MQNGARYFGLLRPAFVAAAVAAFTCAAQAEPVPLPTVDYAVRAKILNDGKAFLQHSNGKMRIEMEFPTVAEPVVGLVDMRTKKMVMLVPIPGLTTTAIEIDFGDNASFGQVLGDGRRVGNDTVAGESCTLWEVTTKEEKIDKAVVCLGRDNIPLKTQATIEGKVRTVFEATEISRAPQDPKQFELPKGVRVMKLPKGLKGIPGFPGAQ